MVQKNTPQCSLPPRLPLLGSVKLKLIVFVLVRIQLEQNLPLFDFQRIAAKKILARDLGVKLINFCPIVQLAYQLNELFIFSQLNLILTLAKVHRFSTNIKCKKFKVFLDIFQS